VLLETFPAFGRTRDVISLKASQAMVPTASEMQPASSYPVQHVTEDTDSACSYCSELDVYTRLTLCT
jgi:hypothetical protein